MEASRKFGLDAETQQSERVREAQETIAMLFSMHYKAMVLHALYFTKNQTDAEDVVMNAFINIYRRMLNTRNGEVTVNLSYLLVATKNAAISFLRTKKNKPIDGKDADQFSHEEKADHKYAKSSLKPDENAEKRQMAHNVREAIKNLPEKFRDPIQLFELEGKSYNAIAEQLKIPRGTVMSRLHRGRKKLKELLTIKGMQSEKAA